MTGVLPSALDMTALTESAVSTLASMAVTAEPWMRDATCAGSGEPDVWFPDDPGQTGHRVTLGAKTVCASCPVRVQCLEYAMRTDVRYGIWGGTTPRERDQIRRTIRMTPRKPGRRRPS